MKKLILIAAVGGFIAVACQKDRTCSCTMTSSAGGSAVTQDIIFKNATKAQAKAGCVSTVETFTATNTTETSDCKLK